MPGDEELNLEEKYGSDFRAHKAPTPGSQQDIIDINFMLENIVPEQQVRLKYVDQMLLMNPFERIKFVAELASQYATN